MRNKITVALSNIIIFVVFFNILIVEFQMSLFNTIIVSNSFLKIALIILVMLYLLYTHRLKIKRHGIQFRLFLIILLLVLYLPLCVLLNEGSFDDIVTILGQNYFFYFLSLFYILASDDINSNDLAKKLFYIGLINALMCIAQYRMDSLLFPFEKYPDGTAIFNSTFFNNAGHTIRSVGFCSSGFDCGILLVFSVMYNLMHFRESKCLMSKIKQILLFVILAYAIYTTKTRNVYLLCMYCFAFLLIYFCLKRKSIQNLFSKSFPIILIIAFCVIITSGFLLNGSQNATNLLSVNTILIRMNNWLLSFKDFSMHPLNFIFGFGISQVTNVVTDNIYIDTIYTFGCVGLFIFSTFWINCAHEIYKLRERNSFNIYLYTITSSIFVIGVGNLLSQIYGFIAIILPLIVISKNEKLCV